MTLTTRPATELDAWDLGPHLRPADAAEFWGNGRTPRAGLIRAWRLSALVRALVNKRGRVECIYGFAQIDENTACPWLVGSEALVTTHRAWFLRNSAKIVSSGDDRWSRFHNFVHAGNTLHIRWLRWTGFTVHPAVRRGPREELFHPFYRNT